MKRIDAMKFQMQTQTFNSSNYDFVLMMQKKLVYKTHKTTKNTKIWDVISVCIEYLIQVTRNRLPIIEITLDEPINEESFAVNYE